MAYFASAFQPLPTLLGIGVDADSCVQGDYSSLDWKRCSVLAAQAVRAQHNMGVLTGDVASDAILLNPDQITPFQGQAAIRFVAPTTGNLTISFRAMLYSTDVGQTVVLRILDSTGAALATTSCVLTGAAQTFSATIAAVAGTEYIANVVANSPGIGSTAQARALTSKIQVLPARSGVVFGNPFVRIEAHPQFVMDTTWVQYLDRYTFYGTNATGLSVDTDADYCNVEFYTNGTDDEYGDGVLLVGQPGQLYGVPWARLERNGTPGIYYTGDIALPRGMKRVTLQCSPLSAGVGTFTKALYLPQTAHYQIASGNAPECTLFYGDSIIDGSTTPSDWTAARSVVAGVRRRINGRVAYEGWGGAKLADDGYRAVGGVIDPGAAAVALREACMSRISRLRPSVIWFAMGTNDLTAGTTAANFQIGVAQWIADAMLRNPQARIYMQGLLRRAPATEAGGVPPAYRTAVQTEVNNILAANPSAPIVYVDGLNILPASGISADGVHPFPQYVQMLVEGILTNWPPTGI